MLQNLSKLFVYVLVFVSMWFISYMVPAFILGLACWDHTIYFSAASNPIYAVIFGVTGFYVAAEIVTRLYEGDYI